MGLIGKLFPKFWKESKFLDTSFNFFNLGNLLSIVAGLLFMFNTFALNILESQLDVNSNAPVIVLVTNILGWVQTVTDTASVVVGCYGFVFHVMAASAEGSALLAFKTFSLTKLGVNTLSSYTWIIHFVGMVAPMASNFILPILGDDVSIVNIISYVLLAWVYLPYVLSLICFCLAFIVARKQDFDVVTPEDLDHDDLSED